MCSPKRSCFFYKDNEHFSPATNNVVTKTIIKSTFGLELMFGCCDYDHCLSLFLEAR